MQDFTKDEKRALAIESCKAPPKYGSESKQQIVNSLHARMLAASEVRSCALKKHFAGQQNKAVHVTTCCPQQMRYVLYFLLLAITFVPIMTVQHGFAGRQVIRDFCLAVSSC